MKSFNTQGKTVVLRPPQREDLQGFMKINNVLYEESLRAPLWIPIHQMNEEQAGKTLSGILEAVKLEKKIYIMVELDKKTVGMGWINILHGMFGEGYGNINIQLLGCCRRLGVGKRLMSLLEKQALKHGLHGLMLTVVDRNPAFVLYKKLGYVEIGRKPNYVASNFNKENFKNRAALVEMLKLLKEQEDV